MKTGVQFLTIYMYHMNALKQFNEQYESTNANVRLFVINMIAQC